MLFGTIYRVFFFMAQLLLNNKHLLHFHQGTLFFNRLGLQSLGLVQFCDLNYRPRSNEIVMVSSGKMAQSKTPLFMCGV